MIGRLRTAFARRTTPALDALLPGQHGVWRGGATFVLSFDVETRADIDALPAVSELLRARGLVASFACIGALVAERPAEHRALLADGHELVDHGEWHPWHDELGVEGRFDQLEDAAIDEEIALGRDRLVALGARVRGFRTPHFGAQHEPRVYAALHRVGLEYSSSTIAPRTPFGGAPFAVDGVVEFPLLTCPRHPADLLDSWHCTTAPDAAHRDPADLVALHAEALACVARHGAYAAVYWDPRVVLLPGHAEILDLVAAFAGRRARLADLVAEVAV